MAQRRAGQPANSFTRTKKADLRWADLALRSGNFGDRSGRGRRGGQRPDPSARSGKYADDILSDAVGESSDIDWDDIVDIVCIGRGAGAMAAAIGAANQGGTEVFFADAGHGADTAGVEADNLAGRLGITDSATVDYLTALTEDIGPLIRCAVPSQVPMRTLDDPQPESRRGGIATFVGSALRDWANRCLASPYGLLYTTLAHSETVTYRSAGERLEAAVVGRIDVENGRLAEGLDQWLAARAEELGLDDESSNSLQRLVFEAGQVVGAVVDTPTGPRAVRARRGVVMETGGSVSTPTLPADGLDNASSAVVALVTRAASRFARLELLATPR